MTITELHQLPVIEKLKIFEALWNDLIEDEGALPELGWHENLLKQTEAEFLSGQIETIGKQQKNNCARSLNES